ncbi:hypothetical protein GCM10009839_11920 [Catenulispora yoronensis]|uniref:Antitoxin n=1 Tax=Catenulispora yoronensis TaxID=450799 RepID=A0ABN2TQJ9_9ACTN
MTTKLRISLPDEDVAFLDGLNESSRSAAVHAAIELVRSLRLSDDYAAAFDEWEASGDAELWDAVTGDGIS